MVEKKNKKMTDAELLNIIEQEEQNCIGVSGSASAATSTVISGSSTGRTDYSDLSTQRRLAMEYYLSQPYGNEVEGRSQVVTSEVLDAIEGIMPALMAIFTSSDEIVRFEPHGPEDEEVAAQATDYINYVFSRINNGFLVLYCLFKDALLLKNGFAKAYWEEYNDYAKDRYEGLTDDSFYLLAQNEEIEVLEHTAYPGALGTTHDAVFRLKRKTGKICIDPVPPEEVLISRDTPNELRNARFVEHRRKVMISKLREMGFEVPDGIDDESPNEEFNQERITRGASDQSSGLYDSKGAADPASREVWVAEAYLRVDYDGDGIAEYRKVVKVGRTLLDNTEFDSCAIVTGTPILMPHKVYGMSVAELVMDLQLIKTTITRQLLDNAYNQNNQQFEVLDGMVNMDDMLTSRPGGIKRVKAIGSIKPIAAPLLGAPFFDMLEYFDTVKENRVGVTRYNQGLDADSLNKTAHGMELIRNAAMQRIELIARILAETCLKDLFWKILELVSKHTSAPQTVKLRGKWVKVDPREWKNRFNMTVTVGLGTGSQQTVLQGAMGIMQIQDAAIKMGLGDVVVTPTNFYQAARLYAKAVFPRNADMLFTDPAVAPPKQPQPNPDILKIQLAAQKAAAGNKQKYDKMMMDYDLAMKQMGLESQVSRETIMHEERSQGSAQVHEHFQNERDRIVDISKDRMKANDQPRTRPAGA